MSNRFIHLNRPCRAKQHTIPAGKKQCLACRDLAAARRALGAKRPYTKRAHLTTGEKRKVRNAYQAAYKQTHRTPPEVIRARNLRYFHGLEVEQWDRLYHAQHGMCGVCAKPLMTANGLDAVVDHDHATLLPRGLVHRLCNRVVSIFNDDPAVAAAFLDAYAQRARDGWAAKVIAGTDTATGDCDLCGTEHVAERGRCSDCIHLHGGSR